MPERDDLRSLPQSLPQSLPGKGIFGWLGRQFGYVSKAVAHDPAAPGMDSQKVPKTVYRVSSVEEKPLPHDPSIRLRRTTIDEVILDKGKAEGRGQRAE